ncbi:cation-translocating P-type ATPase [Acetivibrio ethanolgignens]|uniref:P-type Ca(2+) transporter n=1 Tax=Acetivibrio ethanolgignens TaxID=290052 RepID=A0A0V8QD01_9FIRM|nr:cation-translocating P-type ATPase [Acetivibrio ethanolgignens]KSV58453.1 ATPase [Acetivibrio ethanolgignens]
MDNYFNQEREQLYQKLRAGEQGLSREEAEKRLQRYGANKLREGKKKGVVQVFLEQFFDLLVAILIVAAFISMLSGNIESTMVIFAVILLNAILGTVQHIKAEKSLDSLKALSSPSAKVIRDGEKLELPSEQVVPGDILLLEAGDLVAADGRILKNYSLQVNESSLTGESANVEKTDAVLAGEKIPLADRRNMVFSGSLVTYGRAEVLVCSTGMNTELGRIAELMNATKEKKTPLQVSLDAFSGRLALVIMLICGGVFLLSMYRSMPILDSLMFAVALAVAAIPEALGSIVTIVQAMGTQKMAKENAIMKELSAVESLGCVSVICSDKTGTLTQNKMTVKRLYADEKEYTVEEFSELPAWGVAPVWNYLFHGAVLANDSSIVEGRGIGDPTEYALLELVRKLGMDEKQMRVEYPRLGELPFDSDRKLMSTRHNFSGQSVLFTKGAVDVLLEKTDEIFTSAGIRRMTEEDREAILKKNQSFSENGLRVLAFAYRELGEVVALSSESEDNYVFLGLIAMIDPPREESKAAVEDAKKAGIRTIMITGDHKVTATAIAREIGIFEEGDLAVTGQELETMSERELEDTLLKISVYARVSPEHKIRIVNAWQKRGNIVAMTGDGVNDAPALKKADIGVAMGITGTEVSKDAAAMILADDNFATIIKAVANGRNVYRSIKNAIQFLLSGNMAGIFSVVYTSLAGLPVPFAPVHLLFINLLTDSLPAIAIGMEPAEKGLLEEAPRNPKEGIMTKEFMRNIMVQGGLIAVATMIAFHIGLRVGDAKTASTMAFATLTMARLFHGFNCRSRHSIFSLGFMSNPYSVAAFVAGMVLTGLVLCVPVLWRLFSIAPLTGRLIASSLGLAVLPTVLIQGFKIIRN